MARERALDHAYIEANPLALKSLIVIDHDYHEADVAADRLGLPPTYIALNPYTNTGHIVYALGDPVCLTDQARLSPIRLLARVEHGLNSVLGGDAAYGGRITKNPLSSAHVTVWGPKRAIYGLRDLAGALEGIGALPSPFHRERQSSRTTELSTIGRNVALFDLLRSWAYSRRGDYSDRSEWEQVVVSMALDRNQAFIADVFAAGALSDAEVHRIARSVARWSWRHIRLSFTDYQRRQARRSGANRKAEAADRARVMLNSMAGLEDLNHDSDLPVSAANLRETGCG